MTNLDLMKAMNEMDYRVFPQKGDPTKTTQSLQGGDGKRYFITRVATNELDAAGKPIYIWATGKAMRDIAAPVADAVV